MSAMGGTWLPELNTATGGIDNTKILLADCYFIWQYK